MVPCGQQDPGVWLAKRRLSIERQAHRAQARMNCPGCGHENRPSAKFCGECGTPFQCACPKCGAELPSGIKFCDECGAAVAGAALAARPAEAAYRTKVLDADTTT